MKKTLAATATNPFSVQTPEDIPAEEVVSLFVDVFGDFHHIPLPGHTFLHGPRGSGKSMMFRFLEPDCQTIKTKKKLKSLPFFGVYVPIKNTEIKLTEFKRLENQHAELVLGEHFLVTYVAVKFFSSLLKAEITDQFGHGNKLLGDYYNSGFQQLLTRNMWIDPAQKQLTSTSLKETLITFQDFFSKAYSAFLSYLRKLALIDTPLPYTGPLLGYLDFLLPLISEVKALGFMPGGPVFLLIDDADNLNLTQTRILNGWVSSRTSAQVSLKISTQMNYKTYLTATRQAISSPHDFSEVNISAVYTSSRDLYLQRVTQIVERRLRRHSTKSLPEQFFPPYQKQENEIERIAEELKKAWREQKRGYRASDDATRYARPEYIKRLQGTSKSGSTYKYAGFKQLVHVSDGIVRYFLDAAAAMYGEMQARSPSSRITQIDPAVQDDVIQQQAREFFFTEFDKLEADEGESSDQLTKTKKLRNLIQALGGTFHEILISDASERRVFSVAFSDRPDEEILAVFRRGVQYGYFHERSIGNKEGTGRTLLYVLSRRLAPVFKLDPTSFAGYKFMTASAIAEAMERPKTFLGKVQRGGVDTLLISGQLNLFADTVGT